MRGGAVGQHAATLTATATGAAPVIARVSGRFSRPDDEIGAKALAAAAARWARSRRRPLLRRGFAIRIAELAVPGKLSLVIRAGKKPNTVLAKGQRASTPGETVTLRAGLTPRGRAVLRRGRRALVVAEVSFTDAAGARGWSARHSLVLRR